MFSPSETNTQVLTLCVNVNKAVPLQTASAMVINPCESSTSLKLRIVLDNARPDSMRPRYPPALRGSACDHSDEGWWQECRLICGATHL